MYLLGASGTAQRCQAAVIGNPDHTAREKSMVTGHEHGSSVQQLDLLASQW
jgi:hypothetical protein